MKLKLIVTYKDESHKILRIISLLEIFTPKHIFIELLVIDDSSDIPFTKAFLEEIEEIRSDWSSKNWSISTKRNRSNQGIGKIFLENLDFDSDYYAMLSGDLRITENAFCNSLNLIGEHDIIIVKNASMVGTRRKLSNLYSWLCSIFIGIHISSFTGFTIYSTHDLKKVLPIKSGHAIHVYSISRIAKVKKISIGTISADFEKRSGHGTSSGLRLRSIMQLMFAFLEVIALKWRRKA